MSTPAGLDWFPHRADTLHLRYNVRTGLYEAVYVLPRPEHAYVETRGRTKETALKKLVQAVGRTRVAGREADT